MDVLKDVRHDVAKLVGDSGACETDSSVVQAINDARRILYPLGNWKDTVEPVCVRPYCHMFTLPPDYEYATKVYYGNNRAMVENEWFSKLQSFEDYCGNPCVAIKAAGNYVTFRDWPTLITRVRRCNDDCPERGFRVKVIFESEQDKGVLLTFHGIGVESRNVSLTRKCEQAFVPVKDGIRDAWVTSLTYCIKPITTGRIRVYAYDGVNPDILIALYDPDTVNPQYTRYHISRSRVTHAVIFKAKKRFIKLIADDQPVDIHTDALIHVIQGITDRNNRNLPGYNANVKMATDFLQRELAGPQATSTTPIKLSLAYQVTGLVE